MLKKILCAVLCAVLCGCLLLGLTACGGNSSTKNGGDAQKVYTAQFKSGLPKAPGDVYTAPKGGSGSAITLGQASAQAYPDDSVIVMGEGFSGEGVKAYV